MTITEAYIQTSQLDFSPVTLLSFVIAIVLSLILVVYCSRFYKVTGFFLFGTIAIGFTFISLSYILGFFNTFFGIENDILVWIRLVFLSYGFTFLGLSYYYKTKEKEITFHWMIRICGLSIIPVLLLILVLRYIPQGAVSEFYTFEGAFRIYNLIILGYICKSALQSSVKYGRMEFMYVPVAFAILWLGQYTWLLHSFDNNGGTFVLASVLKVIGLAFFIAMFYGINKTKNITKIDNKT